MTFACLLLVAGGQSVFEVREVDGDHATVESVEDVPGRYPFTLPHARLVPAEQGRRGYRRRVQLASNGRIRIVSTSRGAPPAISTEHTASKGSPERTTG